MDILLPDLIAHIEAAAAGAKEAFPAQIPFVLNVIVVGLFDCGADAEVAVLQFSGEVLLVNTGRLINYFYMI